MSDTVVTKNVNNKVVIILVLNKSVNIEIHNVGMALTVLTTLVYITDILYTLYSFVVLVISQVYVLINTLYIMVYEIEVTNIVVDWSIVVYKTTVVQIQYNLILKSVVGDLPLVTIDDLL